MNALRVLIAEDEAVIAMLLADVLTGMGHEVCAIEATETAAVSAALEQKPGLMIVDVHLRPGSGLAMVEEVLRIGYVPHVFVSGTRIRGGPADAITLQKPFREADLAQAIRRALAVSASSSG